MKKIGWAIIIGGILMGISTLLHPIIINPWSVLKVVPKTVTSLWMWVHLIMLAGISMWLLGLCNVKTKIRPQSPGALTAVSLFIASFTVWVITLTIELGVAPALGNEVLAHPNSDVKLLWSAFFSFTLLSGYAGMALAYLGLTFLAASFKVVTPFNFLRGWGIICGLIGAIGIFLTLLKTDWGVLLLSITTLPPFLWTMILGGVWIKKIPLYSQNEDDPI